MIIISELLSIDEGDIRIDFVTASGPGGQNVNKVASQAQLRYTTAALPEDVRARLVKLAGSRITTDGTLIIQARRYRTQEHNRQDAIDRLVALIQKAALPPKPRKKTRPTLTSRLERLEDKNRRSGVKRLRRRVEKDE
jgi:ribosome-associated protein